MSDWKPVYVVKDGNSKPLPPPASPPKRPRKKRRWGRRILGYSFVIVVLFGSGLAIGLAEDNEAEEYFEEAGVRIFSDALGGKDEGTGGDMEVNGVGSNIELKNASASLPIDTVFLDSRLLKERNQPIQYLFDPNYTFYPDWRSVIEKSSWQKDPHFVKRMEERDISMSEIERVLSAGYISRFSWEFFNDSSRAYRPRYTLRLDQGRKNSLAVVFEISQKLDEILLITTFRSQNKNKRNMKNWP